MAGRFMLGIVVSVILSCGLLSCNLLVQDPKNPEGNDDIFTVTFDSQGGSTPNPAKKTVTLGSPYGTLPVVTRSGLCFGGWWTETESKGSHIYPSTVVTIAADHTLYAGWQNPWARTVTSGSGSSEFIGVTVDSSGNVYVAGYQEGTAAYTYGSGVSVASPFTGINAVLVKYNSSGNALWARSIVSGTSFSRFNSVCVDTSGNVYAVGYQCGTGTFTYGSGVSATGISTGPNVVLVKYNSSGNALWAKTVSSGSDSSAFNSLAVDSNGDVYAAGYQYGNGAYSYDSGVSVTGSSTGNNVVLVKYDSNGNALWARSVSSGSGHSEFFSVAVDSSGNVYAAGCQHGNGAYSYDSGVSVTGSSTGTNVVLVKYNSNGTALWARTTKSGISDSVFHSIAVDSSGNVYAAGYQKSTGSYAYEIGVSISGPSDENVVLVKYNSSGTAQWARTVSSGSIGSRFSSVAIDTFGNVCAAGTQYGNAEYIYGSGISATGLPFDSNVVLVKYSP